MPITKAQAEALRKRIRRFVEAHVDNSWKGSQISCDRAEIERELRVAENDLDNYIERLKL